MFLLFSLFAVAGAQLTNFDFDFNVAFYNQLPVDGTSGPSRGYSVDEDLWLAVAVDNATVGVPVVIKDSHGTLFSGTNFGLFTVSPGHDFDGSAVVCSDTCVSIQYVARVNGGSVSYHSRLGGSVGDDCLYCNITGRSNDFPVLKMGTSTEAISLIKQSVRLSQVHRFSVSRSDTCSTLPGSKWYGLPAGLLELQVEPFTVTVIGDDLYILGTGEDIEFCGAYTITRSDTGEYYTDGYTITRHSLTGIFESQAQILQEFSSSVITTNELLYPGAIETSLSGVRKIVIGSSFIEGYNCDDYLCGRRSYMSPMPTVVNGRLCTCLQYGEVQRRDSFDTREFFDRFNRIESHSGFRGYFRIRPVKRVCDSELPSFVNVGRVGERVLSIGYLSDLARECVEPIFSNGIYAEVFRQSGSSVPSVYWSIDDSFASFNFEKTFGICTADIHSGCFVKRAVINNGERGSPFTNPKVLSCEQVYLDSPSGSFSSEYSECSAQCLGTSTIAGYSVCEYSNWFWVVIAVIAFLAFLLFVTAISGICFHYKLAAFANAYTMVGWKNIGGGIEQRDDELLCKLKEAKTTIELKQINEKEYGEVGCCVKGYNKKQAAKLARVIPGGKVGGSKMPLLLAVVCLFGVSAEFDSNFYQVPEPLGYQQFLSDVAEQSYYGDLKFQSAVGSKLGRFSGGGSCEGVDCICTFKAEITEKLYKGKVVTLSGDCDGIIFVEKFRIESIQPQYTYTYLYTYLGHTWQVNANYLCTEELLNLANHNYSKIITSIGFDGTCCHEHRAVLTGDVQLAISDDIQLHVFKTTYTGLRYLICRQNVNTDSCFFVTDGSGIKIVAGSNVQQISKQVGIVVKNGQPLKVVSDVPTKLDWNGPYQVSAVGTVSGWEQVKYPDSGFSFTGYDFECSNQTFRTRTAYTLLYSMQVSKMGLLLDNQQYPPIQTLSRGLRLINGTYTVNGYKPALQLQFENLEPLHNTKLFFDFPLISTKPVFDQLPFSELVLDSCTYSVGNTLGSYCVLNVHWNDVGRGFLLRLKSKEISKYRVVQDVIVRPVVTSVRVFLVVYTKVEKFHFTVTLYDHPLPDLETSRVFSFTGTEKQSQNAVVDVSYTYETGNTIVEDGNVATLVLTSVFLFLLLFLSIMTCALAIRNHRYHCGLKKVPYFSKF